MIRLAIPNSRSALRRGVLLSFLTCLTTSCVSSQPEYEVIKPEIEYEYLSRSDALIEEILSSPTKFTLPERDAHAAWSRGKLFFQEILHETTPVVVSREGAVVLQSAHDGKRSPLYRYTIIRKQNSKDVSFEITCQSRSHSHQQASLMNAHNLARFMKDGSLARELLSLETNAS